MKIPRERLDLVEKLYLGGTDDGEIQRQVAGRYQITRRQVRTYLARVKQRLAERVKTEDPDAARAQILGLLRHTLVVAERGSPEGGPNANAMVAAITRMAEVQGLMAPKRFEHSGPGGGAIQVAGVIVLPAETDGSPGAQDRVGAEPGPTDALPRDDRE